MPAHIPGRHNSRLCLATWQPMAGSLSHTWSHGRHLLQVGVLRSAPCPRIPPAQLGQLLQSILQVPAHGQGDCCLALPGSGSCMAAGVRPPLRCQDRYRGSVPLRTAATGLPAAQALGVLLLSGLLQRLRLPSQQVEWSGKTGGSGAGGLMCARGGERRLRGARQDVLLVGL